MLFHRSDCFYDAPALALMNVKVGAAQLRERHSCFMFQKNNAWLNSEYMQNRKERSIVCQHENKFWSHHAVVDGVLTQHVKGEDLVCHMCKKVDGTTV